MVSNTPRKTLLKQSKEREREDNSFFEATDTVCSPLALSLCLNNNLFFFLPLSLHLSFFKRPPLDSFLYHVYIAFFCLYCQLSKTHLLSFFSLLYFIVGILVVVVSLRVNPRSSPLPSAPVPSFFPVCVVKRGSALNSLPNPHHVKSTAALFFVCSLSLYSDIFSIGCGCTAGGVKDVPIYRGGLRTVTVRMHLLFPM